jgi:curli biogenesis system outer membrane secretion channel CsgG
MLTDTQDELNLIANGGMPTSELARIGQRVGSDYLVMITVYEHGRIVNDRQLLGTTAIKRDVIDMAEVSVRIIDVATSQIKYAKNQIFQIDPAKAALDEHASFQLGQFISNAIYPAKIVAIDGAVLTIGQGGDTMQNGAGIPHCSARRTSG